MKSNLSRAHITADRKSTRLNSSHLGISYAVLTALHSFPTRRSSDLHDLIALDEQLAALALEHVQELLQVGLLERIVDAGLDAFVLGEGVMRQVKKSERNEEQFEPGAHNGLHGRTQVCRRHSMEGCGP